MAVVEEDQGYTEVEYPIPEEVEEEILNSNEVVLFCWACYQVLYSTSPLNAVTEGVAMNTTLGHQESFSEYHYIEIFRKRREFDH